MQKSAKKEVFGTLVEFGGTDRLDIAYDDSPKCFSTCGAGFCSCMVKYVCIMCINCAKKSKKYIFLPFSWLC